MSTPAPILNTMLNAELSPGSESLPEWKAELNAKLNAHRTRQKAGESAVAAASGGRPSGTAGMSTGTPGTSTASRAMAAQVAARVAARYAKAPSYSDVLAARAVAAADAARNAAHAAQQAHEAAEWLLSSVADGQDVMELVESADEGACDALPPRREAPLGETPEWQLTPDGVSHPEPLPVRSAVQDWRFSDGFAAPEPRFPDPRYSPTRDLVAEATVAPAQALLSKLIEFPRELVAPRKPRPRLAEGPLIEDDAHEGDHLRIFEVENPVGVDGAGSVAEAREMQERQAKPPLDYETEASPYAAAEAPQWQSIRLGEHPEPVRDEVAPEQRLPAGRSAAGTSVTHAPLQTASLEDRTMAALVDLSLVGTGFLLFVLLFAVSANQLPSARTALLAAAALLGCVYLLYQWLFMSYGSGTPGMRYAQIALCSFEDDNPSRKAMRTRVWATVVAGLPVGLGLAWAMFDEDRLGWHDRMARTYQRSYR